MQRIDAIGDIMDDITNEAVVSSCGHISREVYAVRDRSQNFYMMGSMGCSLAFTTGLAIVKPKKNFIVVVGDGEILMSLGTLVLMNKLKLRNLKLYILDNNQYESTGGQKTVSDAVDFQKIADCTVIKCSSDGPPPPRIPIPHKKIRERFENAIDGV